jgi:hypothetical protein
MPGFAPPQRVVRAGLGADAAVEVEARPGLDDRVDVERAELAAQPHDVERRRVHRQVHAESPAAAGGEQRLEQVPIAIAGDRLMDEADAVLLEDAAIAVVRVDDHEPRPVEPEVPLDERQGPAADRAEADHHDRPIDFPVHGRLRHDRLLGRALSHSRAAPVDADGLGKARWRANIPVVAVARAGLLSPRQGAQEIGPSRPRTNAASRSAVRSASASEIVSTAECM